MALAEEISVAWLAITTSCLGDGVGTVLRTPWGMGETRVPVGRLV